jgi:hypothetical protein
LPPQVVRRSGRISKEVPIILIGDDLDGKVFSEHTKTVLLSLHGAGILSKHKLSPEQELILRYPECNKETEIRVVGQLGTNNGVHTYGVAFVDPHLNFWGVEFPPVSELEREMGLLSLVCTSCKTVEKIDETGIEADVCSTGDGVMRSCKRCGVLTLWKPESAVLPQDSLSSNAPQLSLFPSASPSASEPAPRASSSAAASPPPETRAPTSVTAPTPPAVQPPKPTRPASFYASAPEELEQLRGSVLTVAAPEKPARPPGVERRKHPRVKVSYSACVRHPQRGDDVVLCEDMSKGGLRFKSRLHYYPQTLIEVAVPYQPGQPAIFVPAQIVYVEELPEQQLYRYGVQYLRPTRHRDSF